MNAYGQTEKAVEPTAYTSGDWECVIIGDKTKTLKITHYGGADANVTIPETLTITTESGGGTYNVTALGDRVFWKNTTVTEVIMGDNITSIDQTTGNESGYGIFYGCSSLSKITLSTNITYIGGCMFYGCTSLEDITLPNSIQVIEQDAFFNCEALKSITIGTNLHKIRFRAFGNCNKLQTFKIGENTPTSGVLEIGENILTLEELSFANTAFTKVIIPSTLTAVGRAVFQGCKKLTTVEFTGSFYQVSVPDGMFADCNLLQTVTLADNITELGVSTFANCPKLKPESVLGNITNIGESAFYKNTKITELILPDNVVNVGKTAFGECYNLNKIKLGKNTVLGEGVFMVLNGRTQRGYGITNIDIGENENYVLKDGVLFTADKTELVLYPSALDNGTHKFRYKVPVSVTKIAPCAFQNAKNLRNIALPDGLKEIGWMGLDFEWESMTIPSNVEKIGRSALAAVERNGYPVVHFLGISKPTFEGTVKYYSGGSINTGIVNNTMPSKYKNIGMYVKPNAFDSYKSLEGTSGDKFLFVRTAVPMGTLPASGWKSIGRDFDVDLSGTNITAYIVTSVSDDGKKAYMEPTKVAGKEDGKYIPSRTGIETYGGVEYDKYTGAVLYVDPTTAGAGELTYKIGESEDAVLTQQTNYLYPAVVDTYTTMTEMKDGVKYCNLALNDGKFKQYSDDGITGYNKTILSLPETMVLGSGPAGSKMMLSLCIKDETETADIKDIAAECGDDRLPWFTLAGQRTGGRPSVKGIYIHNGKKVVIK